MAIPVKAAQKKPTPAPVKKAAAPAPKPTTATKVIKPAQANDFVMPKEDVLPYILGKDEVEVPKAPVAKKPTTAVPANKNVPAKVVPVKK